MLELNEKLKTATYNGSTYSIIGKCVGGWNLKGKKGGRYTVLENIKSGVMSFISCKSFTSERIENVRFV